MEGGWRGVLLGSMVACCVFALATGGCGESDPEAAGANALTTKAPETAFAPLVLLHPRERWWPVSAPWLIERSVLRFAEDRGCPDRRVAVGRTMPEQRDAVVDWIAHAALGGLESYYRNPHDERCEMTSGVVVYAGELTRPHDRGERAAKLSPGEGFYLDVVDGERTGPGAAQVSGTPVYAERRDEGDAGIRLTYWMLFGASAPPRRPAAAHEGDWERVDVLLRDAGDDRYEPLALQLGAETDAPRDVPWSELERDGTRPLVSLARGSHAPAAVRRGASCGGCVEWPTWQRLAAVRDQPWYGFGGAWGEPGATDATTGPLGPHPIDWPTPGDAQL